MALKYKLQKLDDVAEAIRTFYVEKEEAGNKVYVLDLDGAVDSAKLDEFRTNNKNLHKQLTEIGSKFDGVDPDEYKALKEAVGGLKSDEIPAVLAKAKDLEKIVETRTAAMRKDHEGAVIAIKTDRDRLQTQLSELAINQTTIQEASKLGLRPTAQLDITFRARQVFRLDAKGTAVAFESDGKTVRYGKDGSPLTIREWIESQVTEAPHLFEDSKGAGNGGNGDGKGSGGGYDKENPFAKGTTHYNLTKQGELMRSNPALARRLAAAAGQILPAGR